MRALGSFPLPVRLCVSHPPSVVFWIALAVSVRTVGGGGALPVGIYGSYNSNFEIVFVGAALPSCRSELDAANAAAVNPQEEAERRPRGRRTDEQEITGKTIASTTQPRYKLPIYRGRDWLANGLRTKLSIQPYSVTCT
jgi:hypothetical protein